MTEDIRYRCPACRRFVATYTVRTDRGTHRRFDIHPYPDWTGVECPAGDEPVPGTESVPSGDDGRGAT